ncbi:MAG: DUF3987 domain-containing protein [Burkholderiaceae bacterium]
MKVGTVQAASALTALTSAQPGIKNLCLEVFGGIQPELLERYLAGISNSLDNDGRIQRFQVLVYPNAVLGNGATATRSKVRVRPCVTCLTGSSSFDPLQDGAAPADDFVKLPHFYFDDAAQEIFVEWCSELNLIHIANETTNDAATLWKV